MKAPDETSGPSAREIDAAREIDELTLERVQRGDDDARRALVIAYQGPVFALLARKLGPGRGDRVEDLAQDTFLHVFRALERFAPLGPARLSTWILTQASRRAMDELRGHPPVAEPVTEPVTEPVAEPVEPPEGFAERVVAARHRAVQEGAGSLDDHDSGLARSWWGRFGTSRPALIASAAVVMVCAGVLIAALRQSSTMPAGSGHMRPEARATDPSPSSSPIPDRTVADPCPRAESSPPAAFAIDPAPPRDISRDELLARDRSQREQIARLRAELKAVQRDLRRMAFSGCPDRDAGQE